MSQKSQGENSLNQVEKTVIAKVDEIDSLFETFSQGDLDPVAQVNSANISDPDVWKCINDEKAVSSSPKKPSPQRKKNTRLRNKMKPKKPLTTTSKYFKPESKRWIPPKSPYSLIQESLFDNPWQLLIATIFLQKTQGLMAAGKIFEFLKHYPTPAHVMDADTSDIEVYFKTLGLQNARAQIVKKFTEEYLTKNWKYPRELFGIGKYGDDSYRIFCLGEWRSVTPHDNKLSLYHKYLWQNADSLQV